MCIRDSTCWVVQLQIPINAIRFLACPIPVRVGRGEKLCLELSFCHSWVDHRVRRDKQVRAELDLPSPLTDRARLRLGSIRGLWNIRAK